MTVIAIIPAYNESDHIAKVISDVKKYVDKVIVVDDGSKDNTYDKAKSADFALKHIINLGKGAAMKTGIEKAMQLHSDTIIIIDGDGQHNPADIPRLLKELKEKNFDIVVGARSFNEKMPIVFRLGNFGLKTIFHLLFHANVIDTQSGFRAIRADVVPKILWESNRYAVETEMLARAGRNHLKLGEIPIDTVYHDTVKGTTVWDGIKIGMYMIKWRAGW